MTMLHQDLPRAVCAYCGYTHIGEENAYTEDEFRKLIVDHNIEYNDIRGAFMKCY